jgi:hypothetical protein
VNDAAESVGTGDDVSTAHTDRLTDNLILSACCLHHSPVFYLLNNPSPLPNLLHPTPSSSSTHLLSLLTHHTSPCSQSFQREARAKEMKRLRSEKFSLQRHVKNADEDLKIALDTVDSKDDEATADDR